MLGTHLRPGHPGHQEGVLLGTLDQLLPMMLTLLQGCMGRQGLARVRRLPALLVCTLAQGLGRMAAWQASLSWGKGRGGSRHRQQGLWAPPSCENLHTVRMCA